MGKKEKEEER